MKWPSSILTASVALFLTGCLTARGDSAYWISNSDTGNWSNGANWSTGAAPGSTTSTANTDTATLYSSEYGYSIIVDQPNQNIGSIAFEASGLSNISVGLYPGGGNPLLLTSGGSITDTGYTDLAVDESVYCPLVLEPTSATGNGTYTFTNNATDGGLNFAGNISGGTTTGTITLNLTGTSNYQGSQITSVISNGNAASLGITVNNTGPQLWYLSGSNAYTGVTQLDAGVLNVVSLANGGSASSIGASSNAAGNLVFGGGTLQYTGTTTQSTDRLFTIGDANGNTAVLDSSGTGSGTMSFTNTGSIAFANASTHTLILTGSNTGSNTFASALTDASVGNSTSLTKTGTGTWILTGVNTYTGLTTAHAGELDLNTTGGTSIGGNLTVNGGTVKLLQANQLSGASSLAVSFGLFNIGAFN